MTPMSPAQVRVGGWRCAYAQPKRTGLAARAPVARFVHKLADACLSAAA
jgi:hypothetical protein